MKKRLRRKLRLREFTLNCHYFKHERQDKFEDYDSFIDKVIDAVEERDCYMFGLPKEIHVYARVGRHKAKDIPNDLINKIYKLIKEN